MIRRLLCLGLLLPGLCWAATLDTAQGTFVTATISNTNRDSHNQVVISHKTGALQIVCTASITTGTVTINQSIDGGVIFSALTGTGCAALTATGTLNCAITNPIGIYKITTTGCTSCTLVANACNWARQPASGG